MPSRLEAASYILAAIVVLWACSDYARQMVENCGAGRWLGCGIDALILILGFGLVLALLRLARGKRK